MDNQQFNQIQDSKNNIQILISAAIITALVVGGGVYYWQRRANQRIQQDLQQEIDSLKNKFNQLQQSGIDTSDWQTYKNEEYGFEIKYPDFPTGFRLKEDNATSKLFSGTDAHFWIFVENNTKNLDAAGIKDDYYKNDEYGYRYQDKFVEVAGVNSYKQGRYDFGVIERYYIPKNGKIYRIEFEFNFETSDLSYKVSQINLINNILSTFKFIN